MRERAGSTAPVAVLRCCTSGIIEVRARLLTLRALLPEPRKRSNNRPDEGCALVRALCAVKPTASGHACARLVAPVFAPRIGHPVPLLRKSLSQEMDTIMVAYSRWSIAMICVTYANRESFSHHIVYVVL